MANWCPNCGRNVDEGEKFCRQCGMPQHLTGEDATTWILSPESLPDSERQTARVQSAPTSPATPPAPERYLPPAPTPYYQPPHPATYQPPMPPQAHISLGDWLSGGWQVYKENWALMSVATLLGGLLSVITGGILAGPLLMGMFRMAFATMRGERPVMGDMFNWRGRFLQAFLAFLIYAAVNFGLFKAGGIFLVLSIILVNPLATVALAFVMGLILERNMDVAPAINAAARTIFTRDVIMWWVVGLVFYVLSGAGAIGCVIGSLVTLPWMISAWAVAYRDVFGFDDPNRTNA